MVLPTFDLWYVLHSLQYGHNNALNHFHCFNIIGDCHYISFDWYGVFPQIWAVTNETYIEQTNNLPSGRKEKNRCWADPFSCSIYLSLAAVLRNQGRRFLSVHFQQLKAWRSTGGRRHAVLLSLWFNPLLPAKKSLAPPQGHSGYEYELYHINKQQNTSKRRPVR